MPTDCHVHVSMYPDAAATVAAASARHVRLVGVGCSPEDSERNLRLGSALGYPAMAGIHPWYARSAVFPGDFFEDLASRFPLAGVGECGLDAVESPLSLADQQSLLEAELEFALRHHLPVNLHVRKAHGELMRVLGQKKFSGLMGCIHNFTFSKEIARQYLERNLYLSVGHHILSKHPKMADALRFAGISRILMESDYDHLHTGPYEPALIAAETAAVAEIFGIDAAEAEARLEVNAANYLKGIIQ